MRIHGPLLALSVAVGLGLALEVAAQSRTDPRRARTRPIPAPPPAAEVSHHPVTKDVAWADRLVSPAPRNSRPEDLELFHELGSLEAEGFATLTLSVAGRYAGSRPSGSAEIEIILLPEVPFIVEAWRKDGVLLLEERVRSPLTSQRRISGS